MLPFLKFKCPANITLHFKLPIAHCTNKCQSLWFQMVIDKLIESVSVFVKNQHMNNSDSINEIKCFIQTVRQTIQHKEVFLELLHYPFAICNGLVGDISCH